MRQIAKMHKKKYIYNDLGLAIESLTPTVGVCWSRAVAQERGVSVVGVPVPDGETSQGRRLEQIAGWNPSSSAAGNRSRCLTHLGEAFISGGRFLVENASEWSLNSRKGLQRTLQ
jgi:hypothetical protein